MGTAQEPEPEPERRDHQHHQVENNAERRLPCRIHLARRGGRYGQHRQNGCPDGSAMSST